MDNVEVSMVFKTPTQDNPLQGWKAVKDGMKDLASAMNAGAVDVFTLGDDTHFEAEFATPEDAVAFAVEFERLTGVKVTRTYTHGQFKEIK